MNVNLCKIPKVTNFTHFVQKIFHINPSKIVYIYPSVSVMYIYTVNVGLQINILFYFLSHWSELSLLPHFTLFLSISLSLSSSKEHSRSTIHSRPSCCRRCHGSLSGVFAAAMKIWTTVFGGVAADLCCHRRWHGEGFGALVPGRSSR